jgi:hypothetical protein
LNYIVRLPRDLWVNKSQLEDIEITIVDSTSDWTSKGEKEEDYYRFQNAQLVFETLHFTDSKNILQIATARRIIYMSPSVWTNIT